MKETEAPAPQHQRRQDVMEFYRERIMYTLAIAVFIFVTPFAVINLVQGHYLLSLAFATVVVTFGVDGIALHLKRSPPIPFAYLFIPGIITIAMSLLTEGLPGALGCFPGILLCFFVLPRRIAVGCGMAMLLFATPVLIYSQGTNMGLRFVVALALTIVVIYVITEVIADLQNDLLDQAVTDPLTGAYNRRQMEFILGEAIERHQRNKTPAAVLLIDIDHFKRINDDLGHEAGDQVLKALVLLIKNRSRKLDRLFRIGGEEFLLFLADTPSSAAMKQADNLRLRIAESSLIKQRHVTVSIGIAEYRPDFKNPEGWIKVADNALYQAKETGRNRVICGDMLEPGPETPDSPESETGDRRARLR